jgi:quinol monooxygenase YgiN
VGRAAEEGKMSEPIVYIDYSEVRNGKIEELKTAMNELVELIESNEPQLIAYNVYFNEDDTRVTVVHVHADSASLEFHMKIAGSAFPKFAQFVKLLSIDVYGKLADELLEQVRRKAAMLGNGTVQVHSLHGGFARFRPAKAG